MYYKCTLITFNHKSNICPIAKEPVSERAHQNLISICSTSQNTTANFQTPFHSLTTIDLGMSLLIIRLALRLVGSAGRGMINGERPV